MRKNIVASYLAVSAGLFGGSLAYAQGVDIIVATPRNSPSVEVQTTSQSPDPGSPGTTLGGEYKSTKNVVEEQEKPVFWSWAADAGYVSEYNFRGTNLTPNSGAVFGDIEVSKWGFTLGMFVIGQTGKAHAESWAMGESGGGGSGTGFRGAPGGGEGGPLPFALVPETVQNSFTEIDAFLNYHFSLGPVDITVGNIAFFISRDATTRFSLVIPGLVTLPNLPADTVGDEQFDRVFVRLSTSKIPYITPSVSYYQTVWNEGQDRRVFTSLARLLGVAPFGPMLRNESLGGYLEGRLKGHFQVTDRISIDPYGIISYSFHDRTEPIDNPRNLRDAIRGRSLVDWNVAQAGLEIPIRLWRHTGAAVGQWAAEEVALYVVPSGWYSYHISDPTPGTERDEGWYGVKLTLTF
jgi:hypothetical protein